MAANAQPIFVGTVRNEACSIITGQTSNTGSGSTELYQADVTNGSRIHAISGVYDGTVSTQTVLRMWVETGGTYRLISEIPLSTYTKATGVASPVFSFLDYSFANYLDPADRYLTLDAGDTLYVNVYDTIQANLHIVAFGGDY